VSAQAPAAKPSPERAWWLRALAIFQTPRPVFGALRDDSDEAVEARQEPVLALVLLAAMAAVLTSPTTGTLMDNSERDGLEVAVLVFLAGLFYGVAGYWIGGGALYLGARAAGSTRGYRQARHVLAFAAAPIALSLLVLWPVELAVYGSDLFTSGGSDAGSVGGWVFRGIEAAFYLWSLLLLVLGIRVVNRWPVVRSLGALGLTAFALLAIALVPSLA
jgi:NADH:ubiquinone oxidoreductase subunit 3 (subunit A)